MCAVLIRSRSTDRGRSELDARVDALGLTCVRRNVDGNRVPGCNEVADGVGQVQLTLRIDRLQPVERRPEELGAEDVDRRVRLVDP